MKNKGISKMHESARIYRNHYKPSLNILLLVKSVLSVLISGNSPVEYNNKRRRKLAYYP